MNEKQHMKVEIYIDGLKEIILDVLAEAKAKGERLGVAKIRDLSGIGQQFQGEESKEWATPFTRTLLVSLKDEDRVEQHGKGPGSYWENIN